MAVGAQGFFAQYQQWAMSAGAVLGIPYQVIVAQWGLESTYGTSTLATQHNNFAGIKYSEHADYKAGSYAGYNSFSAFVKDYIRVMQLPYYNNVRQAGGVRETIEELGKSPYATDGKYADKLLGIVDTKDTSVGVGGNVVSAIGGAFASPFVWISLLLYFMFKK